MTAKEIFKQAKELFIPGSDKAVYGKAEYWASYPELQATIDRQHVFVGDCDDFAAWCVHRLREAGLPARYVLCQTEYNEWHCVAETDGYILDNRQSSVEAQNRMPYKWHSISGFAAGEPWHRIVK